MCPTCGSFFDGIYIEKRPMHKYNIRTKRYKYEIKRDSGISVNMCCRMRVCASFLAESKIKD